MSTPEKRDPLLEGHKSFFDLFKHITTLDTAAIMLMIAFLEKAFENPRAIFLAVISFISFLFSLICSVFIMKKRAFLIWREEEGLYPPQQDQKRFRRHILLWGSLWGFVIGMVVLGLFGVINLVFPVQTGIYYR